MECGFRVFGKTTMMMKENRAGEAPVELAQARLREKEEEEKESLGWKLAKIKVEGGNWLILTSSRGANAAKFTFQNKCAFTVWPGTLTRSGAQLSSTRFELASGASSLLDVSCNDAGAILLASLIELTLAPGGGQDFYDVSLVDRFNVHLGVAPPGRFGGCSATSCPGDVNNVCLNELGAYGSPTTCPSTEYSKIFKSQCPHAYSYAYDAKTSTFTCTGGPNYVITFCP
ncbi:hypothetical protein ACFX15_021871 [Malus domestica]